jgi:hypothetical protein
MLFLFLDNALGEYDVATKIGSIEFKELENGELSEDEELLAFTELPRVIDSFFKPEEPLVN